MFQNTQPGNSGIDLAALIPIILAFLLAVVTNIIILIRRELDVPRIIRYIGMVIFAFYIVILIFFIYGWNLSKLTMTIAIVFFFIWFMAKFIFYKKVTGKYPGKNSRKILSKEEALNI